MPGRNSTIRLAAPVGIAGAVAVVALDSTLAETARRLTGATST